jgi:hypothetical protein
MVAACFSLTGIVQAVRPVAPPKMVSVEPYVGISVTPDHLNLGIVPPIGFKDLLAKLKAHVVANCPHQVEASFEPFKGEEYNATIRPEHTVIEINGVEIPVDSSGVSIISSVNPTPPEGVDVSVDIKFSVRDLVLYPAGKYKGAIILTVMTKP